MCCLKFADTLAPYLAERHILEAGGAGDAVPLASIGMP